MSKRKPKKPDTAKEEPSEDVPSQEAVSEDEEASEEAQSQETSTAFRGIPRWRQIEIMREKRELRQLLAEIGDEDIDIDEEIFGAEEGSDEYIELIDDEPEEDDDDSDEVEFEEIYDD